MTSSESEAIYWVIHRNNRPKLPSNATVSILKGILSPKGEYNLLYRLSSQRTQEKNLCLESKGCYPNTLMVSVTVPDRCVYLIVCTLHRYRWRCCDTYMCHLTMTPGHDSRHEYVTQRRGMRSPSLQRVHSHRYRSFCRSVGFFSPFFFFSLSLCRLPAAPFLNSVHITGHFTRLNLPPPPPPRCLIRRRGSFVIGEGSSKETASPAWERRARRRSAEPADAVKGSQVAVKRRKARRRRGVGVFPPLCVGPSP